MGEGRQPNHRTVAAHRLRMQVEYKEIIRPSNVISGPSSSERKKELSFQTQCRCNSERLGGNRRAVIRIMEPVPERKIRAKIAIGAVTAMMPGMFVRRDQKAAERPMERGTGARRKRAVPPQVEAGSQRSSENEGARIAQQENKKSVDPQVNDQQRRPQRISRRDENIHSLRRVVDCMRRPQRSAMQPAVIPVVEIIHQNEIEQESWDSGKAQYTPSLRSDSRQ